MAVGVEIGGAVYGNAQVGRLPSEKEEFGLIGTLNSGIEKVSAEVSSVLGRMAKASNRW